MKFLTFALTYPIIWLISRLPMFILYGISDFFCFVLYHIIGYRKEVVYSNLQMSFPNKTDKELKVIQKKFFKHFTDIIIESIKGFSISEKEISKRYTYTNPEIFKSLKHQNKSIILTGAHYANWEWIVGLKKFLDFKAYGAYSKIQNPYFEKKILKSRTKFGGIFVRTNKTSATIKENITLKEKALYGLLSDQSPRIEKTYYWSNFLNNKVPVIVGSEVLAKKHDFVIINMATTKLKRGYYQTTFELITEEPRNFEDYELTEKYLAITQAHINKQPEYYLWSHKRFKHMNKYAEWQLKQQAKNETN